MYDNMYDSGYESGNEEIIKDICKEQFSIKYCDFIQRLNIRNFNCDNISTNVHNNYNLCHKHYILILKHEGYTIEDKIVVTGTEEFINDDINYIDISIFMDKKKDNIIKYEKENMKCIFCDKYIEKNISNILCKDHYIDQMVYDNLIKKEYLYNYDKCKNKDCKNKIDNNKKICNNCYILDINYRKVFNLLLNKIKGIKEILFHNNIYLYEKIYIMYLEQKIEIRCIDYKTFEHKLFLNK